MLVCLFNDLGQQTNAARKLHLATSRNYFYTGTSPQIAVKRDLHGRKDHS